MSDILQRIKAHEGDPDVAEYTGDILPDAADEITRLRARVEEFESLVKRINDATGSLMRFCSFKTSESALEFYELLADVRRLGRG